MNLESQFSEILAEVKRYSTFYTPRKNSKLLNVGPYSERWESRRIHVLVKAVWMNEATDEYTGLPLNPFIAVSVWPFPSSI